MPYDVAAMEDPQDSEDGASIYEWNDDSHDRERYMPTPRIPDTIIPAGPGYSDSEYRSYGFMRGQNTEDRDGFGSDRDGVDGNSQNPEEDRVGELGLDNQSNR